MDAEKDPVLSPAEMCVEGGISKATWYRHYRRQLEQTGALIWVSPRRCGTRRSKWRELLDQQTTKAAA